MAITKFDQFDFLIDIVPRDELKPPKRQVSWERERRRGKPNCQEAASRVHVRGAGADTGMSTNGWPENTLPCLEMAPLPGNDSTSLPGGD